MNRIRLDSIELYDTEALHSHGRVAAKVIARL